MTMSDNKNRLVRISAAVVGRNRELTAIIAVVQ